MGALPLVDRFLTVSGGNHIIAAVPQASRQRFQYERTVVRQKDSLHRLVGARHTSSDALWATTFGWKLQGVKGLADIGKAKSLRLQFKHQVQSLSQALLFLLDVALADLVRIERKLLLAIEDRGFQKHYEFLDSVSIVGCT